MRIALSILLLSCLGYVGCIEPDEYPPEPAITSLSLSTSSVSQGESFFISLGFTDGDGDFGNTETDTSAQVLVFDGRTDFLYNYNLPIFTESGASDALSGTIDINVAGFFCVPPMPGEPASVVDSMYMRIQLIDRAGNTSELETAPLLLINCQ